MFLCSLPPPSSSHPNAGAQSLHHVSLVMVVAPLREKSAAAGCNCFCLCHAQPMSCRNPYLLLELLQRTCQVQRISVLSGEVKILESGVYNSSRSMCNLPIPSHFYPILFLLHNTLALHLYQVSCGTKLES